MSSPVGGAPMQRKRLSVQSTHSKPLSLHRDGPGAAVRWGIVGCGWVARDHLLPRQLERAGLTADEVSLTDDALRRLAAEYTAEPGVRNLERAVGRVLGKLSAKLAVEVPGATDTAPVTIDALDVVGHKAIAEWRASARFSLPLLLQEDLLIEPTAARVELAGVTVAEFRGTKISRLRSYFDDSAVLEQMLAKP